MTQNLISDIFTCRKKKVRYLENGSTWYKDYPMTIQIFNVWDKNGKAKMIPTKKWTKRDETCQKIVSYQTNEKHTQNIGMVLERLLVIDIDVNHGNSVDGRKTFSEWVKLQNSEKQSEIQSDIVNTVRVNTPSGGTHIYFILPEDMDSFEGQRSVGAMEGVDLLTGKNSYIPAPNSERGDGFYSLHHSSGEYIKQAPQWVLDLFKNNTKNNNERKIKWADSISDMSIMDVEPKLSDINDYEVWGKMNEIITDSFSGFGKGTRNDSMTSHIGKLISQVKKRELTMDNAMKLAKMTAKNCEPSMSEKELLTIWNSILKYES